MPVEIVVVMEIIDIGKEESEGLSALMIGFKSIG